MQRVDPVNSSSREPALAIYIGRVGYGPKLDRLPISRSIDTIRETLRDELAEASDGPSIDIVVHIPGSLGEPDFDGIRTGRLARPEQMVQAEIAVPLEIASSSEPTGPLLEFIASAIVAGAADLARAGIPFDVDAHARAVRRTAARLMVPAPGLLHLDRVAPIPKGGPHVEVAFAASPGLTSDTFAIEDKLIEEVEAAGVGRYEGNEVGQGEHMMFFVGEDVARLRDRIEEMLFQLGVKASIQIRSDDPDG